jgi:orotate phosphoribosyltransferase
VTNDPLSVFERYVCRNGYQHRDQPFTLKSGRTSHEYLDLRAVLQMPTGFYLAGNRLFDLFCCSAWEADAFAAVATGGILPAAGLMVRAAVPMLIAHAAKAHGTGGSVSGPLLRPRSRVIIVEDVVTTGGSVLAAAESLKAEGYRPFACLAVADREEGGAEAIRAAGLVFAALTTLAQIREAT